MRSFSPRLIALGAAVLLAALLQFADAFAQARAPIKVVASFSVLADLVRNVGGDRIELTTLIGPGGDSHAYTPSPADAKRVAAAQLLFVNGLGFEGWLPRLVAAAGKRTKIVEVSTGMVPRRVSGAIDPHGWQSVANAKIYVANIREALLAADPPGAAAYSAAAATYLEKLDALDREVRGAVSSIDPQQRKLVTPHDAFGYFAAAYGLEAIGLQGVDAHAEPTARAIASLVATIKSRRIRAVFREPAGDSRLIDRVASETGAKIGGALYSDSLTAAAGEAPTYIDMIRHNIRVLTRALAE